MKKNALLISLFTIVFAFSVMSVSAQKVTPAQKATTEKASCSKDVAKAGCAKDAAKADCAKTCTKSEAKACCAKGGAKAESMPVPKK